MNRYKVEELKKQRELLSNLSNEEALKITEYQKNLHNLATELHVKKFPEEYDYHYDDSYDAKQRKKGINPMSLEYIAEVNERRKSLGVTPLNEAGLSTSNDTMLICIAEAEAILAARENQS